MPQPTDSPPASSPPIPPIIAWASRNSGVIMLCLLFAVAMIEGVAIFAAKRRDAAAPVPAAVQTPP